MNTRRVPGVTRNSGWQAVDADIVKTRALLQYRDEAMLNRGAHQAAGNAATRAEGEVGRTQGLASWLPQ